MFLYCSFTGGMRDAALEKSLICGNIIVVLVELSVWSVVTEKKKKKKNLMSKVVVI